MTAELSTMATGDGRECGGAGGSASSGARLAALDELARESGVVRVRGTSMLPTLAESSWVRFDARSPRVGDVVVFRRAAGDLVVHRLLGRRPGGRQPGDPQTRDPWIVTKPDAAAEFDVEARLSSVLGTVVEFRAESTGPWRRLDVSPWRRARSALWFGRYLLRRVGRRLLR